MPKKKDNSLHVKQLYSSNIKHKNHIRKIKIQIVVT